MENAERIKNRLIAARMLLIFTFVGSQEFIWKIIGIFYNNQLFAQIYQSAFIILFFFEQFFCCAYRRLPKNQEILSKHTKLKKWVTFILLCLGGIVVRIVIWLFSTIYQLLFIVGKDENGVQIVQQHAEKTIMDYEKSTNLEKFISLLMSMIVLASIGFCFLASNMRGWIIDTLSFIITVFTLVMTLANSRNFLIHNESPGLVDNQYDIE